MNLYNLLKRVGFLVLMLTFVGSTALAQQTFYVNNSSGNDANSGTSAAQAKATVTSALIAAPSGSIISVAAGAAYTEATPGMAIGVPGVTGTYTFVSTGGTAVFNNAFQVGVAATAGTITFTGPFNFNGLTLTNGTLAGGTNVTIKAGGTVKRTEKGSVTSGQIAFAGTSPFVYDNTSAAAKTITTGLEFPTATNVATTLTSTSTGGGVLTLKLDQNRTINGLLTLINGLNLNGKTLSLNSGALAHTVRGNVTGGTLAFTLTGAASLDAGAGAVTVNDITATSTAANTLTLDPGGAGTLTTVNSITASGAASVTANNTGNIGNVTLNGSGTITTANGTGTVGAVLGAAGNTGTITLSRAAGGTQTSASITQSGYGTIGWSATPTAIAVTGNVVANTAFALNTAAARVGQGLITTTNVPVTVGGSVTNSASFTGATNKANSASGNINFANTGTTVTITGSVTNSTTGGWTVSAAPGALTTSGRITFAATTGALSMGNVSNSSTLNGTAPLADIVATGGGTATLTAKAITNSSTQTAAHINFGVLTGNNTVTSVTSSGATTGGDILFGNGSFAATGDITNSRGAAGADIFVGAGGTAGKTVTAVNVVNSGASNITFRVTTTGAVTFSNNTQQTGAGTISFPNATTAAYALKNLTVSAGTFNIAGAGAATGAVNATGTTSLTAGTINFGTGVRTVTLSGASIAIGGNGTKITMLNGAATTIALGQPIPNVIQTVTLSTMSQTFNGKFTVTNPAVLPAPYVKFVSAGGSAAPGNFYILNTGGAGDGLTFNTGGLVVNTVQLDNARLYVGFNNPGGSPGGGFQNTTGYSTINGGFVMMSGNAAQVVNGTANPTTGATFGNFGVDNNSAAGVDVTFAANANKATFTGDFYLAEGNVNPTNALFKGTAPNWPTVFRTEGTFSIAIGPFVSAATMINVTYYGFDKATANEIPAGATQLNNLTVSTTNGAKAGFGVVTMGGAATVNGTLTIDAKQSLYTGANILTLAGASAVVNGNLVDNGAAAPRVQLARATGTAFTGSGSVPSLQVNAASTGNTYSGTGLVSQGFGTDGVWGGAGGAADNFTTFDGNIVYAGGAASSLAVSFTGAGPHVAKITNAAGGTLTLNSNAVASGAITVSTGTIALGANTLTANNAAFGITGAAGAVTGTGTLKFANAAAVITVSTAAATIAANVSFTGAAATFITNNLRFDGNVTLGTTTPTTNTFTIPNGRTLTIGGQTVTLNGASKFTSPATGILALVNTAPNTLLTFNTPAGGQTVSNLTVGGNVTLAGAASLTVNGTGTGLVLNTGTLTIGNANLIIGGGAIATPFTYNGGTLAGTGFLVYNSTGVWAQTAAFTLPNFQVARALAFTTAFGTIVTNNLFLNGAVLTQTVGGVARLTVGNGGTTTVQVAGTGNISAVAGQVVPTFNGTINYLFTGASSAPNAFTWPTAQATNVTVSLAAAANTVTTGASKSIAGNFTETVGQLVVTTATSFTLSTVGATITVDRNGGAVQAIALAGTGTLVAADVNLVYTSIGVAVPPAAPPAAKVTGPEYASPTIVRNVSIGPGPAASNTNVTFAVSRTIAGTLSMFSTLNFAAGVTTNWTLAQTIPAGSIVNTAATSITNWNGGLTVLGTYNNTGTTAGNLSGTGAITNVGPTGVMNLTGFTGTGAGTLVLGAGSVINMTGDATFNNVTVPIKAGATLAATVNTPNNLTFTGTLTNSLLNLTFTGANNQTVMLPGNRTINNFTVTKSADKAVTVSGGNLTLAPKGTAAAAGLLTLTRGIVNMVNPALLTLQATVAGGIITNLGYLRNPVNILHAAHVVGRLGVAIPAGTIGRSEWPVGALSGDYRPAAITFTAGNATIAPTTIIVEHKDSEPTGVKNFPLNGGTQAADPSKTNWIGTKAPYSWLIEATTSLGASQVFDLELQGTKLQKPLQNHNDLRIIRRFDGNVTVNGWFIEGNNATYSNAMSINVPAPGDTMLTVRDRGSLGSAIAQKAFFTIGAPATQPVFNLPTTLVYNVAEGSTTLVPVKAISNSVNTTITKVELLNAPSFVTLATVGTDSGTVSIKPTTTDASTTAYTAQLKATDSQGATVTITLTITVTDVNAVPVITKSMSSGNIKTGDKVDSTYTATDADAGDVLTFFIKSTTGGPTNAATITAAGAFSWQSATADAGKSFTFTVAVTDGKDTTVAPAATITVVANRAPTWAAGGEMATPQTIFVGDTLKQTYKADDLDNDPITYAFVGNHPADASLNASTGVFSWAPKTASQFPVLITVSATDGKSPAIQTQAVITIKVATITVSGKVTYDNTSNTPIAGATVKLMNGTTVAGTATTNATGDYSITGVTGGTSYTITATKTTGWPSAAVLASDALLAARSSVGAVTLTANQKLAADVTGDGNVTAGDALQILRRVVGAITSFTISDWQFETNTVVVGGGSVTANFKGIAAGDVNQSATTLPKKSEVSILSGKNIKISPNSEFELPVTVNAQQEVGAFTFRFTYPVQMMTFKSVKSNLDVISHADKDKISIAWAKIPGSKSLKDGETPKVVLVFKATKAFVKSSRAGLTLDDGEIVNLAGKNLASASVGMSEAEVAIPSTFALSQNYPNPFNPSTVIEYQLPVNGNVTLTIYNALGQKIQTLIDNQVVDAGSYKTRWNATNIASGIYFYTLKVEGAKSFFKTRKMILLK